MSDLAKYLVGAVFGLIIFLNMDKCSGDAPAEREKPKLPCDWVDYIHEAETYIQRRLVAPATADFNYGAGDMLKYNGSEVTYVNYVDSENRFGAKLRLYFKVWMRCNNGEVEVFNSQLEEG